MPRLSILTLFFTLALLAFGVSCARAEVCSERITLDFADNPADHLVSASHRPCDRFWQGTLPQSGVRAEIMIETALSDTHTYATETVLGLKIADAALIKLGSGVRIGDHITVILASKNLPAFPNSDAYADLVRGNCYLVILPRSRRLLGRPGALAFIMAHELFHCVQQATLPSGADNLWWKEGSAHWFAHMAQPNQVVETYSQSANKFERETGDDTLRQFEYSSWPFFAWYAQHTGNAQGVMRFLEGLPDGTHTDATIASLLDADAWGEFAKQYSAYQIKVTPRVPVNPRARARLHPTRVQLASVGDERDYPFRRRTGALERYKVILKAGDWQFSTESAGAMYLSEIGGSGDPEPDWQKIGAGTGELSLSVPCGENTEYALVGFGSNPDNGNFVLTARKVGDPCELTCAAPPSGHDACFSGIWHETTLAIPGFAKSTLAASIAEAGGDLRDLHVPPPIVTFFPGSDVVTVDATGSGTVVMRGRETKLEITLGRGESTWSTSGGKLLICPQTVNIRGNISISAGGRTQNIPFSRNTWPSGKPEGILFDYTCDDTTVTVNNAERDIQGRLERR